MVTFAWRHGIGAHPKAEGNAVIFGVRPETFNTLLGLASTESRLRKSSFTWSFVVHALALVLLLVSSRFVAIHAREIRQQVAAVVTDISPYTLPSSRSKSGGGGGGGDRSKLAAPRGALPRFSRTQIVPPAVVVRNESPKLAFEPTVVVPPQIKLPHTGPIGDPLSAILSVPSNGPGFGGGVGSGSGGGIGSGTGPGVGPGYGGGIGGGVYQVGGGVSAPRVIYSPEPEFSDEARKAKYQGTVVLSAVVGTDGRTYEIHVRRALGMGLDEKAIQAIQQWKFEPGRKDGIPVAVLINVEVNFRLY